MIPSIRLDGTTVNAHLQRAEDTAAIVTCIEDVLSPKLTPGDIVVMNNLPAHDAPSGCFCDSSGANRSEVPVSLLA